MTILITVLAHNEEARIAACLDSLAGYDVHVVVNGSTDRTADIARGFTGVTVHDYAQGGKSRSWNRFVLKDCPRLADTHVFVDGDAVVAPGSIDALDRTLRANPDANAVAALPLNGRQAAVYRHNLIRTHGMFGDLYALRGSFVARMRAMGIQLPEDLIGDDSLIGALAKTDLGSEKDWVETRIVAATDAGWHCEQTRLTDVRSLRIQYKRMINYSTRHFQNRMVSAIMRKIGPIGLPQRLTTLYPEWLPRFTPRMSLRWWWFDRQALARMRVAATADRAIR